MAQKATVANLLVQVSAEMGQLRAQLAQMEGNFRSSFNRVERDTRQLARNVTTAFAGIFGTRAVFNFTRNVIDSFGAIKDAADRTGLSGQLLSGLESELLQAGTTVEQFANSVFIAQKNVGGIKSDTDSAAQAAKRLGLNWRELRQMNPEEFFDAVSKALASIKDPTERAYLGAQLLGRTYGELAPAISQVAGRLSELKAAGLSDEDIAKLDEYGDAWTRVTSKIKIFAGEAIVDVGRALGTIRRLIEENQAGAQPNPSGTTILNPQAIGKLAGPLSALSKGLDEMIRKANQTSIVDEDKVKRQEQAVKSFFDSLDRQVATTQDKLTGGLFGDEAVLEQQLDRAFSAFKKDFGGVLPAGIAERFETLKQQLIAAQRELKQTTSELDAVAEAGKRFDLDSQAWSSYEEDLEKLIVGPTREAREQLEKEWNEMREGAVGAGFDLDSSAWATFDEDVEKLIIAPARKAATEWHDTVANLIRGAARGITESMRSIALGTQSVSEAFRNLGVAILTSLADAIVQLTIIEPLITRFKAALSAGSGAGTGGGFGFGEFFSTLFSGLFTAKKGGLVPFNLPKFDTGGLIVAHPGEFVLQKSAVDTMGTQQADMLNRTGRLPTQGGQPVNLAVETIINGSVTPNPGVDQDKIVETVIRDLDNRGPIMLTFEQRTNIKGG